MAKCKIHKETELVTFCPKCLGKMTSTAKAEAARENGRLGGRPELPPHSPVAHRIAGDAAFKHKLKHCPGCTARG